LEQAQRYFASDRGEPTANVERQRGVYEYLQDNQTEALQAFRNAIAERPTFSGTCLVVQWARELGTADDAEQLITAAREFYKKEGAADTETQIISSGNELLDLLNRKEISDD